MTAEVPKSKYDPLSEEIDTVNEIIRAAHFLAQFLGIDVSELNISRNSDESLSRHYEAVAAFVKARGLVPESLDYIEAFDGLGDEGTGRDEAGDREPRKPAPSGDLESVALPLTNE